MPAGEGVLEVQDGKDEAHKLAQSHNECHREGGTFRCEDEYAPDAHIPGRKELRKALAPRRSVGGTGKCSACPEAPLQWTPTGFLSCHATHRPHLKPARNVLFESVSMVYNEGHLPGNDRCHLVRESPGTYILSCLPSIHHSF